MTDVKLYAKLGKKADYKSIIEKGELWTDPDFTRDVSLMVKPEEMKPQPDGKPDDHEDWKKYGWKRASEFFAGQQKVYENLDIDDIEQGDLGDCYMLSAMSALAEFPGRVQKLLPVKEGNKAGCYPVNLYVSGQLTPVVVDDFFPVKNNGKKPAFSGSKTKELWVMLIEKAWAKIHGRFFNVEGGDSRESLGAITGAPVEYFKHSEYESKPDELWHIIKVADETNCVMCTGANKEVNGIIPGHAYTLINAFEFTHEGKNVRLVQIRNPWGCSEWKGAWSDGDKIWTAELNKKMGHTNKDDGTFFMPFDEFRKIYIHCFIARAKDEYIHSFKPIRKAQAGVVFTLPTKVKGYISAYQITSRLGKSMLGAYTMPRLIIELYKVDGGKLMLVKNAASNVVGPAHIEAELEPGNYFAYGRFDKSEVVFPYICFVAYTNKLVEFAELSVEPKDVTQDKVQRAMIMLKTTKPPVQKKPSFDVCARGHKLAWNTEASDDTKSGEEYLCENCRAFGKAKEGRWLCKECSFDICPKCKPREITTIDKDTGLVLCKNKHEMKFAISMEDTNRPYLCDKCGRAYKGIVQRWMCKPCSDDFCRYCVPPPPGVNVNDPIPEIINCYRGHKFVFSTALTRTGKYDCDFCSKTGESSYGRWFCAECNSNVCPVCKPHKDATKIEVAVKTKTVVCEKGHMLYFTCRPYEKGDDMKCHKCGKHVDTWRWNCKMCEFDVCTACRPEPEGRRDAICKNMHKLAYSIQPQGSTTYGRCDNCSKAFNLVKGRHHCNLCHYEMCLNCLAPLPQEPEEGVVEHARRPGTQTEGASDAKREECGCSII